MFNEALSEAELFTWQSLKSVITNFQGNFLCVDPESEIEKLQKCFRHLGTRMSVKLHFLWSYLDYFPKDCTDRREKESECFHQDIRIFEERYQGLWNINFLLDYYWCLRRDSVAAEHKRKSLIRFFILE